MNTRICLQSLEVWSERQSEHGRHQIFSSWNTCWGSSVIHP